MPPSRQKSCLACVQSKRKCEKGLPKCQRCLVRNIDCEYTGRYPSRLPRAAEGIVDEHVAVTESFAESLAEDMAGNRQLQRSPTLPSASFISPFADDAFMSFVDDPFNLASVPNNDFIGPTVIDDIVAQQSPVDDWQVKTDAPTEARVEFAARRLAAIPKTFSEQGQTMFIHRFLFQERSSPALQDALSACALYCLRNAENQVLVFRNLEHRRQQLISSINPLFASRMDLLAALQALILYQIIRLFDGDIRLRAQAEADESILITWAGHLRLRTRQLQPSPPSPPEGRLVQESSYADWQRWLAEESSRRTVITAFMLKGVYNFLKLGYDTIPDLRMTFTAQAALWNSQSQFSWQSAHSNRDRLEMMVAHWDEVIARAKPSDLDELAVLVMAMLKGIEATAGWLGRSNIVQYGLEEPK